MVWDTPKTNWAAPDGVTNVDMNRIEGNTAILSQQGGAFGITAGTPNTYTVAATPPLTALSDGSLVSVKVHAANTGALTLDVNGLGAKAVKKGNGNDIPSGGWKVDAIYTLRYSATANGGSGAFILQGEGGSGTAQPGDVLKDMTFTNDAGDQVGTLALTGDAVATDVLATKTFYSNDAKTQVTGTMPNNGALGTIMPGTAARAIPAGYTSGGSVAGDANLIPDNIVDGVTLFSVLGTHKGANGMTQLYTVKQGSTIAQGDFVDFDGTSGDVIKHIDEGRNMTPIEVFKQDVQGTSDPSPSVLVNTNKSIIAYRNSSGYPCVRTVTTNGNGTITLGTPLVIVSTSYAGITICKLDIDKALVVYDNAQTGSYGVVITANGTTLSAGAITALNSTGHNAVCKLVQVDIDKAFFIYTRYSDKYPCAQMISISGTTVSFGTSLVLLGGAVDYITACKLDSSHVAFVYNYYTATDVYVGSANIGTDGLTLTKNNAVAIDTNAIYGLDCAPIDSNNILVFWSELNHYPSLRVANFDATYTVTFPVAQYKLSTETAVDTVLESMNGVGVYLAAYNRNNSNGAVVGVYWDGASITVGVVSSFNSSYVLHSKVSKIDNLHALWCGAFYEGTVYVLRAFPVFDVEQKFGVAKTGGSGGSSISIII